MTTKKYRQRSDGLIEMMGRHSYNMDTAYEWQQDVLADRLLLGQPLTPKCDIIEADLFWFDRFPHVEGMVIAGSTMFNFFNMHKHIPIQDSDIDIYVKSFEDAKAFLFINDIHIKDVKEEDFCLWYHRHNTRINLIWGVKYSNIEQLLGSFDIRACAIGYDFNTRKIYAVEGAVDDLINKRIFLQPSTRAITMKRIVKYLDRGFHIDKKQQLMFTDLVRSDIYSREIEISGGYKV